MKTKSNEQIIFPIIVGAFSLYTLVQNIQHPIISSLLVSLLGLVGVALFFLNKKIASGLFYVWIISQLVTYQTTGFAYFTDQVSLFHLGITFQSPNSVFAINFVPLFFFIGYRILKMYDLIGKKVSIKPFKADSPLTSIEGEISAIVNRGKEGRWLKVDFQNDQQESQSVLIKPKGDEHFSKKKSILGFVNDFSSGQKFIDWGKVRLK